MTSLVLAKGFIAIYGYKSMTINDVFLPFFLSFYLFIFLFFAMNE